MVDVHRDAGNGFVHRNWLKALLDFLHESPQVLALPEILVWIDVESERAVVADVVAAKFFGDLGDVRRLRREGGEHLAELLDEAILPAREMLGRLCRLRR